MDSLIIKSTGDSPAITFDTSSNRFSISGESRPENAARFYTPIMDWLTKFEGILYWRKHEMNDDSKLNFVFELEYFNSTSAKYIMDILLIVKKFVNQGYQINIEWRYDKNSDDILDAGKEFSSMINLKFDLVEI